VALLVLALVGCGSGADPPEAGSPDEPAAVPGGGLWGTAVVIDGAGMSICQGPPGMTVPESITAMRVELVDAQGAVIACLGLGG
jgi:hypothetical protein